jgi:ABC-type nitrate/sulfonate/bicarbonate transport system ATPase subunit
VHVLTSRPGRIAARLVVDLPRPRTADTFLLPEFARLEQQVLGALGTTSEVR